MSAVFGYPQHRFVGWTSTSAPDLRVRLSPDATIGDVDVGCGPLGPPHIATTNFRGFDADR